MLMMSLVTLVKGGVGVPKFATAKAPASTCFPPTCTGRTTPRRRSSATCTLAFGTSSGHSS
eukprot:1049071-Pyramimonas_sp.AAC.1